MCSRKIENHTSTIAVVFIILFITFQVVGSFFQSNLTWGFHLLGFSSLTAKIGYLILLLAGLLFIFKSKYEWLLDKVAIFMTKKPSLFLLYTIVIFIGASIILRVKIPLLGDGFVLIKAYENLSNGSEEFIATRQPVAFLFFHFIIKILGTFTYPEIMAAFLAGELLIGAGFIIITFSIVRILIVQPHDRLLSFLFILSFPYIQLFFGYVELYAVVLFIHSVFLLGIVSYFNKNTSYVFVLLLYLLLAFSNYLSAVLFAPSLIYLTFAEFKIKGKKNIILGLFAVIISIILVLIIIDFRLDRLIPRSEHEHYLTLTPSNDRYQAYTLFSPFHLIDILNLLMLMAAPTLLFIILIFFYSRKHLTDTPVARFLLLFFICLMLFLFIAKYDLPMALDWDMTAPLFYVAAIYAVYVMMQSNLMKSVRIIGLIIFITTLSSMLYFQINASENPNVTRTNVFLNTNTASQSGLYQTSFHLSMYYLHKREIDNLIRIWESYNNTYPNDDEGYENLIKAYWELGEKGFAKIDETFEKWIRFVNDNADIKVKYANICMQQGNYYYQHGNLDGAAKKFNMTIELKNDIPGVYNNLGLIYYEYGNYDSALYFFERAIITDSNYVLGYKNMAKAYVAKGESDTAIQLFQKAISLNPYLPIIYEDMAKMYDLLGKQQKAIDNYQKAARLGSTTSQQHLSALGHQW